MFVSSEIFLSEKAQTHRAVVQRLSLAVHARVAVAVKAAAELVARVHLEAVVDQRAVGGCWAKNVSKRNDGTRTQHAARVESPG